MNMKAILADLANCLRVPVEIAQDPDKPINGGDLVETICGWIERNGVRLRDIDELYAVLKGTDKQRQAVTDALGRKVEDDVIAEAVREYKSLSTRELTRLLQRKEKQFESAGGRGVTLADEIDRLRIARAVREVEE
jgi:hypothetical protein